MLDKAIENFDAEVKKYARKNIIKKLESQGIDHNQLNDSDFDSLVADEIEILKSDSKKVGTGIANSINALALQPLIEENQASRVQAIETAEKLYSFKQDICKNQFSIFSNRIKLLQNIPPELKNTIIEVEAKVCSKNNNIIMHNKVLLSVVPEEKQEAVGDIFGSSIVDNIILSDSLSEEKQEDGSFITDVVGATVASHLLRGSRLGIIGVSPLSIFDVLEKKKKLKEQVQKKIEKAQTSTSIFQSAINKMEFLLENTQDQTSKISDSISALTEGPKNYHKLSTKQQEELLALVSKMNLLAEELTLKINV